MADILVRQEEVLVLVSDACDCGMSGVLGDIDAAADLLLLLKDRTRRFMTPGESVVDSCAAIESKVVSWWYIHVH